MILDGDTLQVRYAAMARQKLGINTGGGGGLDISAGASSAALSSVTFADSNNVSFGLSNGVITAIANTVGGGAITNMRFSAGTYSTYRSDITFANSNGVSFGQNTNGVITATVATNYQSQGAYLTTAQPPGAYLTTAMQSDASTAFAGTGFTTATTGGTNIVGTLNTNGLSMGVPAYLTTAAAGSGAGTGFTTATTAGTDVVGTLDTNGFSMGVPAYLTTAQPPGAYLTTAMASDAGSNFAGTNGSMVGGSFTLNTSGATISLPAYLTTAQPPGAYLTTAMASDASSAFAGTGATIVGGSLTVNTAGVNVSLPAYLTTAMASNAPVVQSVNGSSGVLSISGSGLNSVSNNNSTIIVSARSESLNEIQDPTTDKVFHMASNQVQFEFAVGGSFSTNATRQGMFEIDVQGNVTQEADVVHAHYHAGTPTALDLFHIEADASAVTGLRLQMSASVAAEINQPIKFTTEYTNYSIGSVPMILGTQMSNVVANLNANYLQGSQASQFQSAGPYLTTAQPVGNYAGTGTSVVTTGGTDLSMALNTGGLTVAYPKWITTYVNDLTSARAGTNTSVVTTGGTDLTFAVNTSGVTIAYPKWITTAVGGGAGTGFTSTSTAGAVITAALGTNGLSMAVPNYLTTAAATNVTSDRAGTNTSVATTGGTDLSFAVNTSGATIAYPKWITTYVNDLTSDRAGTVTGATGCSVTANTSGISVNVPAGAGATVSVYPDLVAFPDFTTVSTYYSGSLSVGAGGNSTASSWTFSLYFAPMVLPAAVAFSQIRLVLSNGTAAGTGSATQIFSLGFYTNNASTLSLSKSYCAGIVLSQNSSNAWTYSLGTATTAGQSSNAAGLVGISLQSYISSQGNLNSSLLLNGSSKLFRIDVPAVTLPAGQYWVALGNALRTSGAAVLSLAGVAQCPGVTQRSTGFLDCGENTSASAPMFGSGWGAIVTNFSSSSNAATWWPMPSGVALSNIVSNSTANQRYHFALFRNQ